MTFRLPRAWWGASATARRRHGAVAVAMVCARRQAAPSGLPVALAAASRQAWQCLHTSFAACFCGRHSCRCTLGRFGVWRGGWQESAWRRVLSMVAYYYNVAPASLFAQSWPARQAVSGCNGGRFAMQSGPFGGLKRPVPQCAGGQRVGQVVPFFEIIVTL